MIFVGVELGLFYLWKIGRREFRAITDMIGCCVVQIIAGFTGCLHFRHPFILGGFYYSMSMLWAQVFPFVALHLYNNADGLADNTNDHDDLGENVQLMLICSFAVWLMLNVAFFCTIDLSYIFTFFSIERGPAWVVRRFKEEGAKDSQKFDVIFDNNLDYSKPVHGEVKEWIAANIDRWRSEMPEWFQVEIIPDEFLPKEVFEAEGGAKRRRRSSVSLREIVGLSEASVGRVHPQVGEEIKVEEEL